MTAPLSEPFNIASLLSEAAAAHPDRLAVVADHRPDVLGRTRLTYAELDETSSRLAALLMKKGFTPGLRVIVMIRPGLDFMAVIFALFKAGLIPVMVDPGMGARRMLTCLAQGRPGAMIGIPAAHILSLISPKYFKDVRLRVTVGRRLCWRGPTLYELLSEPLEVAPGYIPAAVRGDDTAAILFTSGATGPAKGAIYTHRMFQAQIRLIQRDFEILPGGVDLATFPLFALFAPALGLTSITPNMNPTKPARVDPRRILDPIAQYQVTSLFASPSLLARIEAQAREQQRSLPSLRRVISAGAPVPPGLAAAFTSLLPPEATLITPYGATEGVPLTIIEAEELRRTKVMTEQGLGICVGRPLTQTQLAIIKITETPIARYQPDLRLPAGEIGEIIARSPVLSPAYFERPGETELAIIPETAGPGFWRRMGDLGWMDGEGRLWFCGRKNHRVVTEQGTLFSIPCEAIFNNHPLVRRSALVGLGQPGRQTPVIIVELKKSPARRGWSSLTGELRALAKTNPRTLAISTFLAHRSFPVDVRHNAKINREKLALWAAGVLARTRTAV